MQESWNKIRCPYCFSEFAHDEVHFRLAEATCQYAHNNLEEIEQTEELEEYSEVIKEGFSKFVKREEIDPKFYKVWGDLRGGEPTIQAKDLFYVPWVDQCNKSEMIDGEYLTDQDGFVEKIVDQCGHFESKTRICPCCHNKLPLHYGKNPQKFISILGVSASGKTVFLKQLLAKIQSPVDGVLNHVNGAFVELTLPDDDNAYLQLDQPLPDSTRTLNFKVPYFLTLNFRKDGVLQTYDFVIYDVAGEILVDLLKTNENKFEFFAGYIRRSDAIITLIDPWQLVSNPQPEYQASEMVTTLYRIFGATVQLPTAVTISKSDLLLSNSLIKQNLDPEGNVFKVSSPVAENIPWDPEKLYFYSDEYKGRLLPNLKRFYLSSAMPFYNCVDQQIENPGFFAVSALFDGVDQMLTFELRPRIEWKSEQIDDYIQKFPILRGELEDIRLDLQDQENHPDENIIDANDIIVRRSFIFGQNDDVVEKLDRILGQVSTLTNRAAVRDAVKLQFGGDEDLELLDAITQVNENLSIRQLIKYINDLNVESQNYSFDIYMQGYPRRTGNLNSLRIEEPFFWLLSEMKIIDRGNVYTQNAQTSGRRWRFGGGRS